jgi:hypothetical protein
MEDVGRGPPDEKSAAAFAEAADAEASILDWTPDNSDSETTDQDRLRIASLLMDHFPDLSATPFSGRDPASIPRRKVIYPGYTPKHLQVTIGQAGIGKSGLLQAEAIAICTGIPVLGLKPNVTTRVWYCNLDDPQEEVERSIAALLQFYCISKGRLRDRLFIDSGGSLEKLKIVRSGPHGAELIGQAVDDIALNILKHKIGVFICEPLIAVHTVSENANEQMEVVARTLAGIGRLTGAAICTAHHPRKSQDGRVTTDDSRGGSALAGVARAVRVVNLMTPTQARDAGIPNHRQIFSVEVDKSNFGPTGEKRWFRLRGVTIANGDDVRVVEAWTPPTAAEVVSDDLKASAQALAAGGKYREDSRSPDWFGFPLAGLLGLNVGNKEEAQRLKAIIREWIAEGVLRIEGRPDHKRRMRDHIVPGPSYVPLQSD